MNVNTGTRAIGTLTRARRIIAAEKRVLVESYAGRNGEVTDARAKRDIDTMENVLVELDDLINFFKTRG